MSCLFQSLGPAIGLNHQILRQAIAGYLRTDPKLLDDIKTTEIIKWTEGKDLKTYATQMARGGTWGGAIEIRAYCELFNVDVRVHVLYTGQNFDFASSKGSSRIVHISYTGNHFEPMYTEIKLPSKKKLAYKSS